MPCFRRWKGEVKLKAYRADSADNAVGRGTFNFSPGLGAPLSKRFPMEYLDCRAFPAELSLLGEASQL